MLHELAQMTLSTKPNAITTLLCYCRQHSNIQKHSNVFHRERHRNGEIGREEAYIKHRKWNVSLKLIMTVRGNLDVFSWKMSVRNESAPLQFVTPGILELYISKNVRLRISGIIIFIIIIIMMVNYNDYNYHNYDYCYNYIYWMLLSW